MKKVKGIVARNDKELAEVLGLSAADMQEINLRIQLTDRITSAVAESGKTHAQIAKLAGTSRTRVTAIVNRNTGDMSTDLLLRVLNALGYKATFSFRRIKAA